MASRRCKGTLIKRPTGSIWIAVGDRQSLSSPHASKTAQSPRFGQPCPCQQLCASPVVRMQEEGSRVVLARECVLHPAAQIKGTSASDIHQKAFNAEP